MTSYDQPSSSNQEIFAENASTSLHSLTSHRCVATLKSHNSYTSSLVLAGEFLFTGSSDREIRMWNRRALSSTHENPAGVVAGKGAVKSLVVSSDKIFSAHQDNKIRAWKINDQNLEHVATLPILSDRAIKYLRPRNHVQIRRHKTSTWVHHVDAVSALALSLDESLLYSVSWDRTLKIWSTADFKCIQSIENAHDDAINALAASLDGRVYTGSADKKIKVWGKTHQTEKKHNHSLVATLEKHSSGINALAVDMNGSVLYSGSCDGSVLVWEKNGGGGGRTVAALRGHKKAILCLGVVGGLACSGSADKTIRIWRGVERCYSCVAVLAGHGGPVKCLTAASDCHDEGGETSSFLLYSGGLDGDTKVWEIFVVQ